MSNPIVEEGIDDPSDFQAAAFQDLDEHFRCPICKEFFETTMILSTCSHSFCALCIRRSLSTEQNCPQCRKPAYETALIHNYALDHVVNTWRKSRSFILNADRVAAAPLITQSIQQPPQHSVQQLVHDNAINLIQHSNPLPIILDDDNSADFVPAPVKHSSSAKTPSIRRSNRLSSQTSKQEEAPPAQLAQQVQPIVNNVQQLQPAEHTTQFQQYNHIQSMQQTQQEHIIQVGPSVGIPSAVEVHEEPLKSTSMVECPICTQMMAMIVLNQHIDNCMRGDSRIPPTPSPTAGSSSSSSLPTSSFSNIMPKTNKPIDLGRKPSKVVYAMLNDKDLRKLLKDLGLSEQGDRNTRIWRHKEYINLYNANYDSDSPVSANVLIQRLNMIEHLKETDKYNQLKRKATDLDEHKMVYKSQFDELTENAKRNRMAKKNKESTSQEQ